MVIHSRVSYQLRQRLHHERERHGWSQSYVCDKLKERGVGGIYPSTIAKIESGDRLVHTDELVAYADIFGVSVDALLDRKSDGTDVLWAVSKLTSSAQKTASEVRALHDRIDIDLADVRYYSTDNQAAEIMAIADDTLAELRQTELLLSKLASQFPIPR